MILYNISWEDFETDASILNKDDLGHVFMITSGGCNVINTLTLNPLSIDSIDVNHTQNYLLELKIALFKNYPEEFYKTFTQGKNKNFPYLLNNLDNSLSKSAFEFWKTNYKLFSGRKRSFFHKTKSGSMAYYILNMFYLNPILKKSINQIFEAESIEEQIVVYKSIKDKIFSNRLISFFDKPIFSKLSGVVKNQYDLILQNSGSIVNYINYSLEKIMRNSLMKDNPYWSLYYYGRYNKEVPRYLKRNYYNQINKNLHRINIVNKNIIEFLKTSTKIYDTFILLDLPDWFNKNELENLFNLILNRSSPSSKVLFRSVSNYLEHLPKKIFDYFYVEKIDNNILKLDRVGTYKGTFLLRIK